jgi:putative transposase
MEPKNLHTTDAQTNDLEIRRGYEYRLQPTSQQRDQFFKYAGAYRFIFNWGLAKIKAVMDLPKIEPIEGQPAPERPKIPGYFELCRDLTILKQQEETLWLKEIHSQVMVAALKDLDFAMKNFFRRVKRKEQPGFPKFKAKRISDAFRFPQIEDTNVTKRYMNLPKIGPVPYINSRDLVGMPKTMTIKREGDNWFIVVSTVLHEPLIQTIMPELPKATIGLEFINGSVFFNILDQDGVIETIPTPTPYRDELVRLTNLTISMKRKEKESANREKCIARINKIHLKIRNQRKDWLHKLSRDIVSRFNSIVIVKLPIKEMMDDQDQALSLSDCGWHSFVQMLRYKSHYARKHFKEE